MSSDDRAKAVRPNPPVAGGNSAPSAQGVREQPDCLDFYELGNKEYLIADFYGTHETLRRGMQVAVSYFAPAWDHSKGAVCEASPEFRRLTKDHCKVVEECQKRPYTPDEYFSKVILPQMEVFERSLAGRAEEAMTEGAIRRYASDALALPDGNTFKRDVIIVYMGFQALSSAGGNVSRFPHLKILSLALQELAKKPELAAHLSPPTTP